MKWTRANASTSTQPMRRAPRLSHGAAAVSAAVTAAMPKAVGKPSVGERPSPSWTSMTSAPGSGSNCSSTEASPFATIAAAATVTRSRQPPSRATTTRPPTSTTAASTRVPTTIVVMIQLGNAFRPAEQVLTELHEGVAEQPLHDAEDDEHDERDDEPKDVGR